MKIKHKIIIFLLINFCLIRNLWAEVKIEKIVPQIIDNSASTPTESVNNIQNNLAIDSIIDQTINAYPINPKNDKIRANNFGVGFSVGKKIAMKNLINSLAEKDEYFQNKFILAELFFNKKLYKKSTKNNMEIDAMQGFRSGLGSDFNNFNLAITSNIFTANYKINSSKNSKNLFLLFGVSTGYKLNKNLDLRCNIISSFGQKIKAFNNNLNNLDLSLAINF